MPSLKLFNRRQRAIERVNRYAGSVVNGSAKPMRRAEILGVDGRGELIASNVKPSYSFDWKRSA